MLKKILLVFFGLLFSVFSHTYSEIGSIDILDKDGVPCFKIPDEYIDRYGTYGYGFIEVQERMFSKDPEPRQFYENIWRIRTIKPVKSVFLKDNECIKYGENFRDMLQTNKVVELVPGRIYSALVAARPVSGKGGQILSYGGKFCLSPKIDGVSKVHQIEFKNGERDFGPCRIDVKGIW